MKTTKLNKLSVEELRSKLRDLEGPGERRGSNVVTFCLCDPKRVKACAKHAEEGETFTRKSRKHQRQGRPQTSSRYYLDLRAELEARGQAV